MAFRKWEITRTDKELAKELAAECDIDDFTALVALARGYDDPVAIDEFLSDEILIADPYELTDITVAAAAVNQAIDDGKLIGIYGDYDCDGVTATALLYTYLCSRGARTVYFIPDRFTDGYGLSIAAVDKMNAIGVEVVITVDNGISAIDEVEYANSLGMQVIVTDHHLPKEQLPNAVAVVDPHRADCPAYFKDICGVGVAFKLVSVISGISPEELIYEYGDLLAIGTVADVMPLVNENRSFVKAGVEVMKNSPRVGLEALLKVAGIEIQSLTASKLTFGIVPRINAVGRIADATEAVRLLVSHDSEEAAEIAERIGGYNTERQRIEKEIFDEAVKIIEQNAYNNDRVIVAAGNGWHHGVIGIAAAKICERYGKPAIVFSLDGNTAVGSGRSFKGFSLYDAINAVSDMTLRFGGHELAAGLAVAAANVDEFRARINAYAKRLPLAVPVLKLDLKLNPAAISLELAELLGVFEPFGNENPVPLFAICNLTVLRITPIGNNRHLRLKLGRGDISFTAVLFGVSQEAFEFSQGDKVDIAATLEVSRYNGSDYVSVQIKNIRAYGIRDDEVISEAELYESFKQNDARDYSCLYPTRDECAAVYKFIQMGDITKERVVQKFITACGYGKIHTVLDAFTELGIIKYREENGTVFIDTVTGVKVNLADSKILQKVKGE